MEQTCVHCGKKFQARRVYVERGQYQCCSNKCRKAANRKGVDPKLCRRVCKECGQVFTISPGEFLAGKERHHCSKACQRKRMFISCGYCGKEIEILHSEKRRRRYCSKTCYHKSRLQSRPEQLISEILKDYGIEFEAERPFGDGEDKRKTVHVDFWLSSLGVALEFDGGYWHDEKRNAKAERRKSRFVDAAGGRVVRVRWEDIKDNPERSLLRIILRALQGSTES